MRSVAKGNYIKGRGSLKHALSHVRYLEVRGGDDRARFEGKRRLFIDATRDGITGREVRERIKTLDERRMTVHRIVLSPGIEGVDMEKYTRAIMSALEHTKGKTLEYYATEHQNTDHDHTHVVILGDKHGNPVRLTRGHYQTVREAGDRYIERNHPYEQYLDKDSHNLMQEGYVRDRGDQSFEWLMEDLNSKYTLEEIDGQRADAFVKIMELRPRYEETKIIRDDVSYSQFSPLDDLIKLDQRLRSGEFERVSESEYSELRTWIGNKKQYGDDYYERTAENQTLHQIFEEQFRNTYWSDTSPPVNFNQRIFEGRGRFLTWHERYTINTHRSELEKELAASDDEDQSERRLVILEQLAWLDNLAAEFRADQDGPRRLQRTQEEHEDTKSEPADQHLATPGYVVSDEVFDYFRETVKNHYEREAEIIERSVPIKPNAPVREEQHDQEPVESKSFDREQPDIQELLFGKDSPIQLSDIAHVGPEIGLTVEKTEPERERVDDDVGSERGR